MTKIIDMTPTWSAVSSILIAVFENGTPEGRLLAQEEIKTMAKVADKYNELVDKLNVDNIAQIIRQVDGKHDLGAGELAEKIIGRLFDEC